MSTLLWGKAFGKEFSFIQFRNKYYFIFKHTHLDTSMPCLYSLWQLKAKMRKGLCHLAANFSWALFFDWLLETKCHLVSMYMLVLVYEHEVSHIEDCSIYNYCR